MSSKLTRRSVLLSAAAPLAAAQTDKKIRVAFIGTGHRTWIHIPVMKEIQDFEIVALADPTPEFLDRAATLAGGQTALYSDYRKMLSERDDLDAVVIVTPDSLHARVTADAFAHGLHVLCEKPMATSIEDANRMIEAANKSGKVLQIGHQMRFRGVFAQLAEQVRNGAIGPVEFVTGYLHRGDWNPRSWKVPHPETGKPTVWRFLREWTGSSMLEDGVHELDILQWVINSPVARVYASGGNAVFRDRETIDHAAVVVDYENGTRMNFGFCLLAKGQRLEQILVAGADGHLVTEASRLTIKKNSANRPVTIDTAAEEAAGGVANPAGVVGKAAEQAQLQAFADSVKYGRVPLVDGEAGKNAILIPLMAQKSIDEGRIVTRKEFPA